MPENNINGIIIKAIAGFYYVETGDGIYECKARGIFRKEKISPTVGDKVSIEPLDNNKGIIDAVLLRKNCLIRPPVANIDRLFIVSSENTPAPNSLIIDRLTAIAVINDIEPIIVFNKCDLGNLDRWCDIYIKAGFKSVVTSAVTGDGCDEIKKLLIGHISAFTGNSGVGKSSLLNVIFPMLNIETGDVSKKLGRGRHTTRKVELYKTEGGYVADTPGFSSLDIERTMSINKEQLAYAFSDFDDFSDKCKFTSCAHIGEKGCKVCEAVKDGKISESRYNSYKSIYNEIKDIKEWEKKQ